MLMTLDAEFRLLQSTIIADLQIKMWFQKLHEISKNPKQFPDPTDDIMPQPN